MLRAGYTAPCRFFRDSDVIGTIRWFRCDPDAPPLGYESAISSLQQRGPYFTGLPVGEVFPLDFKFDYGDPVDLANYDHVCGQPIDFSDGGLYLPDEPPVLYAASGLPVCCAQLADGVMLGGEMRPHRDEGVALDGSMLIRLAGNVSFGGPIVPLSTAVYHPGSTDATDFSGGWLVEGGFHGGTYRVDWFQSLYPTAPTGGILLRVGTPNFAFPPNGTSLGAALFSSGAGSGSTVVTLMDGERLAITFTSPAAIPPAPFRPATRSYKFIVYPL